MTLYTPVPKSTKKDVRHFTSSSNNKAVVVEAEFDFYPIVDNYYANKKYVVSGVGSFDGVYNMTKIVHRISKEGYTVTGVGEMDIAAIIPPSPPPSNKPTPAPTNTPKDIVYVVKKGDSLWAILKAHGKNPTKYSQLAKYNNISNPSLIYTNQTIKIPSNL